MTCLCFVILLTWKPCERTCLQPALPQASGEVIRNDCSQTQLRLMTTSCGSTAVCANYVQVTFKNVFFAAMCWSHSTAMVEWQLSYQWAEQRTLGPPSLGLFHNWFRSLRLKPRRNGYVLCGKDAVEDIVRLKIIKCHGVCCLEETSQSMLVKVTSSRERW